MKFVGLRRVVAWLMMAPGGARGMSQSDLPHANWPSIIKPLVGAFEMESIVYLRKPDPGRRRSRLLKRGFRPGDVLFILIDSYICIQPRS